MPTDYTDKKAEKITSEGALARYRKQKNNEILIRETENYQLKIERNVLLGIQENVRVSQNKQAELMKTRSKKYIPEINFGDHVILTMSYVDKGLTEVPNLICHEIGIYSSFFPIDNFEIKKTVFLLVQTKVHLKEQVH
ncbi:hypothetical protein BpHYR1_032424 [Brachionus plicatilis]|uniref:Uncharacterized protein n=1 Tax=Brachionus plicatilis TaxID=10195 RepID=A0A3M7T2C2_BRAPC|nr:hypothetical protein BpHYR1_032424 [Brachionus plicatilis]